MRRANPEREVYRKQTIRLFIEVWSRHLGHSQDIVEAGKLLKKHPGITVYESRALLQETFPEFSDEAENILRLNFYDEMMELPMYIDD
jgi:hypothetical protein